MSRQARNPAARRMLPDEDVNSSTDSMLELKRAKLKQKTLYEYGIPTTGPNYEQGLPKERAEFECPI